MPAPHLYQRCRLRILLSFIGILLAAIRPAAADDVGITSARLIELADGGHALEADVAPGMVAAIRTPVVPERFQLAGRPIYRRVGVGLIVRYEFGGSDEPLTAGDVILLPWARSAVLLTARWLDGSVQRAMFPRGPSGIRITIETLRPIEHSATAVARRHLGAGLDRTTSNVMRLLLVLGLVVVTPGMRAIRLTLVIACGHALSMVALDAGVPALSPMLAAAGLGLGTALLARHALRDRQERLWPLALGVGLVDGLGLAGGLTRAGLAPGELDAALFGTTLAINVLQIGVVTVLALAWRPPARQSIRRGGAIVLGGIAVAAVIVSMHSGLHAAGDPVVDAADRMAAARLDFKSGGAVGATAGGGRAAAPPRRLDDAALIFLTVEPMEVRAEVLLRLRDFLRPLRIEGNPGAVVPVEAQSEIAARARRMVAGTIGLHIDGREAVAILTRTDFVTVAATGVTTRTEPEPEPLDTSVIGVTLVYGADRPPSEIELRWQLFPDDEAAIPAVWTDPTGSERVTLTPGQQTLRWAGNLSGYAMPPVEAIEVRPPRWPLVSLALVGMAAVAAFGPLRRRRAAAWAWVVLAWVPLAIAIVVYPFVRNAVPVTGVGAWAPGRTETAEIVGGVLTNVYRSFDLRNEEAVYDRLAASVTGEQLSEVYLENRRALELENRGGARARVDEVEVLEVRAVHRDAEGGFRVETTWTVSGSVNHFGHVHYRQNRYDAALVLIAVDGIWKIRSIEILDERRLL